MDKDGFVVVSQTVFLRLKEVGLPGLDIIGEEPNPEPMTLQIPGLIHNKFKVFRVGVPKRDG